MEHHYPEITRGIMTHQDQWWVKCSCGYEAGPFPSKADADTDADDHILAIGGD